LHDDATADGTVRTNGKSLPGVNGLEHLGLDFDWAQVKAQAADGKTGGCGPGDLDKLPSVDLHNAILLCCVLVISGCRVNRGDCLKRKNVTTWLIAYAILVSIRYKWMMMKFSACRCRIGKTCLFKLYAGQGAEKMG
jgi:hypothetical protein